MGAWRLTGFRPFHPARQRRLRGYPPARQAEEVSGRKHAGSLEALRVTRPEAVDLEGINKRNRRPLSALRCHRDRLSTAILAPFLAVVQEWLFLGFGGFGWPRLRLNARSDIRPWRELQCHTAPWQVLLRNSWVILANCYPPKRSMSLKIKHNRSWLSDPPLPSPTKNDIGPLQWKWGNS